MPRLTEPVVAAGRMRALQQPTLDADGLVVRPWQPDDAPTVFEAYQDPAIPRYGQPRLLPSRGEGRVSPDGTMRLQGRHADGWHDMHVHARLAD